MTYQLKINNTVLLEREQEAEIYDAGLYLAERNIGVELTVHKDGEERSRFMVVEAAAPKYWAERAIQILNSGCLLKETLAKHILEALPTEPHWVHWTEVN
jgi:hypothetical protein